MDKKDKISGSHIGAEHIRRKSCHSGINRLVFAVTIVTCLLAWIGVAIAKPPGGQPSRSSAKPPMVIVTAVGERDVNPAAEFVGRVEAIQVVDLRARVEGFLEEVRFKEGTYVKAGDLLYVIEQAPYQAQLNIDKAKEAKARAVLTKAEQYLKRLQTTRSGTVSATDIDSAVSEELQARAAIQEAEATVTQSSLSLSYTRIKAPISGLIGRTAFTRGNLVGPNSGALARIVQMDPIRVVFSISETGLQEIQKKPLLTPLEQLQQSRIIRLRLPNADIYPSAGRLAFIDNKVDSTTGTIAFRTLFDNPDGYLIPGQYVNVLISTSTPEKMPVIPQAAVLEDREGRYVLVVDRDNVAQQRRIQTGETLGTEWAVTGGLTVGETVIVQGIQKVRPGQQVQPSTGSVR
jgi:RND family efflux transporter MFP subunit